MGFQTRVSGERNSRRPGWIATLGLIGMLACMPWMPALGQASGDERIWVEPQPQDPGMNIAIGIQSQTALLRPDVFRVECPLDSASASRDAKVTLELRDAQGALTRTGQTMLDLAAGQTPCAFDLSLAELPLGTYEGRILVTPAAGREPAFRVFLLRLSNLAQFTALLDEIEGRLNKVVSRLTEVEPRVGELPSFQARIALAKEVLQNARADAAAESLTALDRKLAYLQETVGAMGGSLLWGAFQRDFFGPPASDWSNGLLARDGGFFQGERPVWLVGSVATADDMALLERLHRYGLNFAVLQVGGDKLLDAAGEASGLAAQLGPFFDAAMRHRIRVAVQVDANKASSWALERWPDLAGTQADMSHPGVQAGLEKMVRAVLPYVAAQTSFVGLSLAANPRFRFDGEAIKKQFIEQIRVKYPERPDLNRIWHAHLSNLDDITIWGDHPPYSYQNRAPYQFDWQSFHHERMLEYVNGIVKIARETAPKAPLSLTFSDNVFERGETRTGLPREPVSALLDLSACSTSVLPKDPIYAMSYPRSMAYYALLKSMQPEKPIVNFRADIAVDPESPPEQSRSLVRTALLEQAIAGVNAAALPSDSPVWSDPWAAEALVATRCDVERLAPVIHAFQHAPAEIGIVFSQSSKILDDGKEYLSTACSAFEGCSFTGYNVRFVTEAQVVAGQLARLRLLVMPETPALPEVVFKEIENYVNNGGVVVRVGTPIPYDERGRSRQGIVRSTDRTYLVRGKNESTEYLHAIDTVISDQRLPSIARAVNANGYPPEGLKTRTVEWEQDTYLYLVNLRRTPMTCRLAGTVQTGIDLLSGKRIEFPKEIPSMMPMLIRLDRASGVQAAPTETPTEKEKKKRKA